MAILHLVLEPMISFLLVEAELDIKVDIANIQIRQAEAEQVVKHSHKRRLLFPNSLYAQHLLELVGRSLESQ